MERPRRPIVTNIAEVAVRLGVTEIRAAGTGLSKPLTQQALLVAASAPIHHHVATVRSRSRASLTLLWLQGGLAAVDIGWLAYLIWQDLQLGGLGVVAAWVLGWAIGLELIVLIMAVVFAIGRAIAIGVVIWVEAFVCSSLLAVLMLTGMPYFLESRDPVFLGLLAAPLSGYAVVLLAAVTQPLPRNTWAIGVLAALLLTPGVPLSVEAFHQASVVGAKCPVGGPTVDLRFTGDFQAHVTRLCNNAAVVGHGLCSFQGGGADTWATADLSFADGFRLYTLSIAARGTPGPDGALHVTIPSGQPSIASPGLMRLGDPPAVSLTSGTRGWGGSGSRADIIVRPDLSGKIDGTLPASPGSGDTVRVSGVWVCP